MSVSFAAKKWERVYNNVGITPIGEVASFSNEQKAKSLFDVLLGPKNAG